MHDWAIASDNQSRWRAALLCCALRWLLLNHYSFVKAQFQVVFRQLKLSKFHRTRPYCVIHDLSLGNPDVYFIVAIRVFCELPSQWWIAIGGCLHKTCRFILAIAKGRHAYIWHLDPSYRMCDRRAWWTLKPARAEGIPDLVGRIALIIHIPWRRYRRGQLLLQLLAHIVILIVAHSAFVSLHGFLVWLQRGLMLVEHVRELLNGFSSGHADATDNWLQSDGICDRRKRPLLLLQTEARATALLVKAHKMHWMLEQLRFWLLCLHCLMLILLRFWLLLLLIHLKEHFITIVLDFVQTARGCCSGCSAT